MEFLGISGTVVLPQDYELVFSGFADGLVGVGVYIRTNPFASPVDRLDLSHAGVGQALKHRQA